MIWPSAIGVRSTSMGTPAAIVEASGFICAISGTSVAAAPMAPTAPVATKRKSRRVGSAADMVVTVQSFQSRMQSVGTADLPERRAPSAALAAATNAANSIYPLSDAGGGRV